MKNHLILYLRRIIQIWTIATIPIFLASAFTIPWPSWLQTPWSHISDFAVSPNGNIYVYNGFYSQMMVYRMTGEFLHSWPGPGTITKGLECLSFTEDGRLYLKRNNSVFGLSPLGQEIVRVDEDRKGSRIWRLTKKGNIENVKSPTPKTLMPDRPIRAGEILFGEECDGSWPHTRYPMPDGGFVQRRFGSRLQIHYPDGRTKTLMTPWYLLWGQVPYLILPLLILKIWDRNKPPLDPMKALLGVSNEALPRPRQKT